MSVWCAGPRAPVKRSVYFILLTAQSHDYNRQANLLCFTAASCHLYASQRQQTLKVVKESHSTHFGVQSFFPARQSLKTTGICWGAKMRHAGQDYNLFLYYSVSITFTGIYTNTAIYCTCSYLNLSAVTYEPKDVSVWSTAYDFQSNSRKNWLNLFMKILIICDADGMSADLHFVFIFVLFHFTILPLWRINVFAIPTAAIPPQSKPAVARYSSQTLPVSDSLYYTGYTSVDWRFTSPKEIR